MRDAQKLAIEAAKEITIAAMQGSETPLTVAGDTAANFYEAIYNKVFELASKEQN